MSGPDTLDEFIQLNRTFHELSIDEDSGDDKDFMRLLGRGEPLRWPDLLVEHRVVLLAEAGSGKTEEVRSLARSLRQEGEQAFFVRIEHVTTSFEDAFDEGGFEEFTSWVSSGADGWLLLDSVDEARLRDPKEFERAIKKLGRILSPVLQQAHIVITGRTVGWRAKTDLLLCRNALPYEPDVRVADEDSAADEQQEVSTETVKKPSDWARPFRIVTLDDLDRAQIDAFLRGKNVQDLRAFREEVERKDAWSLTTRPQDLAELVEFWNEHRRIGSRLELVQTSVRRRLEERDQDRAELRPISAQKLREGVRLVAAAATLARESAIRVPDGADNAEGIPIKDVLSEWDDIECATLLSRPIFDEGIYGTVRFHHRSVREFLIAEWLHGLIVDDGSRARVEDLFFRSQYGIEVIAPTMRPVLPWLAILDGRLLTRVCRLAPEVLFEGGDPSQLPQETRSEILHQACEQLAQPAGARLFTDYAAVQRFANADLTGDIRTLLDRYRDDDVIAAFLLRMVWIGEIEGAAAEAKDFALNSRARYTRIAAFRALKAVGTSEDQAEVRQTLIKQGGPFQRDWLAELVRGLPQNEKALTWLLEALRQAAPKKRHEVDTLSDSVSQVVADWPLSLIAKLVSGLHALLSAPPFIERLYCEMSQRYRWLARAAAEAMLRLLLARESSALQPASLSVLRTLAKGRHYLDHELRDVEKDLTKRVREWAELNHALFWQDVTETRVRRESKKGERLTDYREVDIFGSYWAFDADSFDSICDDITARAFIDDKLVALTLAFDIYRGNGRPAKWRARLKRLAVGERELEAKLRKMLHPPAGGPQRKWKQQEARWKRRAAREAERAETSRREWKAHLDANLEALRNPGKPGVATQAQYYLHERMREDEDQSGKWTEGNWRSLIPEFGEPIARAFRDGALGFWRGYRPRLRSEGAKPNLTTFHTILGLTGLSIEAREDAEWAKRLSPDEAEIAARYALHELNGFPAWMPSLYRVYPQTVIEVVINEIDHELATEDSESQRGDVLQDASSSGSWMWDRLAPLMVARLGKSRKDLRNLRHMLTIVQGSPLDDAALAKLAARKVKAGLQISPLWFAVWVGVEPEVAIPALRARLAAIARNANRTRFAMTFATTLVGSRHGDRGARSAFRTVAHMKTLYLLIHEHVRTEEDIHRVGSYSPGLRDDAQDARDALLSFIRETPGKEAFLAMMEISRAHPAEGLQPWIAFHAKEKAARDADGSAWSARQVREFHDQLERTPANHRELWHLAVDRLLDLKHDLEQGDASIASIFSRSTEKLRSATLLAIGVGIARAADMSFHRRRN